MDKIQKIIKEMNEDKEFMEFWITLPISKVENSLVISYKEIAYNSFQAGRLMEIQKVNKMLKG